jgi:uncharacterized protein YndB with AHSA1/START domain
MDKVQAGGVALTITKTFDASIDEVYSFWTDPQKLATWYGPEGFTNTVHSFELKEGGEYRLTMHAPNGEDYPLRGEFKTIQKPTKLVFTWQWEGGDPDMGNEETLVTVELQEVGGKTQMTFTHEGFPNDNAKANHTKGWTSSFGKLEKQF